MASRSDRGTVHSHHMLCCAAHSASMHCSDSPSAVVCSFLLQLSLLDLECSAFTPSMLAAAGLSVACEVFAKEAWPASLQQYSAYTVKDLQPCKDRQVVVAILQGVPLIAHAASWQTQWEMGTCLCHPNAAWAWVSTSQQGSVLFNKLSGAAWLATAVLQAGTKWCSCHVPHLPALHLLP